MLASVLQAASPSALQALCSGHDRRPREARRHLQRDWHAPTHKQGTEALDAAACQRHNRESDLGILDLIQVFVEALDRSFENVCELDLIFHSDKCHYVLDEIIIGGLVLDTSITNIMGGADDQNKLHKSSLSLLTSGPKLCGNQNFTARSSTPSM